MASKIIKTRQVRTPRIRKKSTAKPVAKKAATAKPARKKAATAKPARKATKKAAATAKALPATAPKKIGRPGKGKIKNTVKGYESSYDRRARVLPKDDPLFVVGKKTRKRGGQEIEFTIEQRRQVETLAGLLPVEQIALLVFNPYTGEPISEPTLRKHFADELEHGRSRTGARVGQSIIQRAQDIDHPQGFQAAKFYLGTQHGWNERQVVDITATAGVLVAPATPESVDQWVEKVQQRNADKPEPGGEE